VTDIGGVRYYGIWFYLAFELNAGLLNVVKLIVQLIVHLMQFKRAFGKPVVKRARTQAKFTICQTVPACKGNKKGGINALNRKFCVTIDYHPFLPFKRAFGTPKQIFSTKRN